MRRIQAHLAMLGVLQPAHSQAAMEPTVKSQRFITTSKSAQEYIMSQRHKLEDRATIGRTLKAQKLQNTKTNLTLGFDKVDYESDAMVRQKDILRSGKKVNHAERAKELADMKRSLQKTSFSFGTDMPDYRQVSTLPDPSGHIHEYTGQLNTEVKNLIKKSNVYFGSDQPIYTSNQSEFFKWRGGKGGVDFAKRTKEIADMKRGLTSTSFNLGHDEVNYRSMYQDTFNNGNVANMSVEDKQRARKRSQEIKKDLRLCHYVLGHDPSDYRTTMQRQFEQPDMVKNARDREEAVENSRAMKAALQKSNLYLGNDELYM